MERAAGLVTLGNTGGNVLPKIARQGTWSMDGAGELQAAKSLANREGGEARVS